MADIAYDLTHSSQDALRADLSAANESIAVWRLMALAALDQLHEAQQTIARQQRQIAEMREERERYARSIFSE